MLLTVYLSLGIACTDLPNDCFPVLTGRWATNTPTGTFKASHRLSEAPGYGGDIVVFKESTKFVWAIHRTYKDLPHRRRAYTLDPQYRAITGGCINLRVKDYNRLAHLIEKVHVTD